MSARRRMPAAFGRLWAGQTISELGSQVTVLALPLVAIKTLHAGPVAVGLLGAAETLPFLLIGLPAGAWVDRHRRRPLLLAMDLARAFVLVTVPVAYLLDRLVLAQLLAVALAVGVASVIFDVAAQAYVPALVAPGLLLGANARLETSRSAAQVAGPGLGGVLIQALKAPMAVVADCASFVISAGFLASISEPELESAGDEETPPLPMRRAIAQGISFVRHHELLRPLALSIAVFNLFSAVGMAVFLLYAVHRLGLSAAAIGLLYSFGSFGYVAGAAGASRLAGRLGMGRAVLLAAAFQGSWFVLVPLAPKPLAIPFIVLAMVGETSGNAALIVLHVSIRQAVTPPAMLGRMTATARFVTRGMLPIGSLLGGLLGASLGLRPTLWVSAIGGALSTLVLVPGPLRSLGGLPAPARQATTTT